MKKRLSITLSTMCVSACVLAAPVSVQGMRSGGDTPNQNRSCLFLEMFERCNSEIGKAFHEAARNSDFERMAAIVSSARSEGKDIADEVMRFYRINPFLPTFLHECENPELVIFAVENGMRELINYKVLGTATPLITARNTTVAQLLIDNGADVNHADTFRGNPLFNAHNAEVAQLLIDNGADVNHSNPFRGNALFDAHNVDVVQVLIDRGADVNHTTQFGLTPLFCAQNAEVAQLLIDRGADVNHTSRFGHTPLFWTQKKDVAQLLIDNGADVNHTSQFGLTPLFCVQNAEVAQLLIDHGADVNHADSRGRTPLMTTPNPQVAQVLIDNGANIEDLRSNHFISRRDIEQLFRDNAR